MKGISFHWCLGTHSSPSTLGGDLIRIKGAGCAHLQLFMPACTCVLVLASTQPLVLKLPNVTHYTCINILVSPPLLSTRTQAEAMAWGQKVKNL